MTKAEIVTEIAKTIGVEKANEKLTDNCECSCHCDGECHCHEKQPEIFDESDIDRIVANLYDWD